MNCNPPLRGPLSGDRDTPQPNLPAQSRRRPIGQLPSPEEPGRLPSPAESHVVSTAGLPPAFVSILASGLHVLARQEVHDAA
jgi:hypothetical protein